MPLHEPGVQRTTGCSAHSHQLRRAETSAARAPNSVPIAVTHCSQGLLSWRRTSPGSVARGLFGFNTSVLRAQAQGLLPGLDQATRPGFRT